MFDITTAGLRVFENALQSPGGAAGGIVDNARRIMRVVNNPMNNHAIYSALELWSTSVAAFGMGTIMISTDFSFSLGIILCLAGTAGVITSVQNVIEIQ